MKRVCKILAIIAAVLVGLMVALQLALNSPIVDKLAHKYADEYIDGDVSWSRIRISMLKNFPRVRVTVDSLALTYPHERYAAYDAAGIDHPFLSSGRGAQQDTLAAWDRFTASVSLWKLLHKNISLDDAGIDGLSAYAHAYDTTAVNWDIFKGSEEPEDTTSSPFSLPWIKIGDISFRDSRLVYTDQSADIFGAAELDRLHLEGDLQLGSDSLEVKDFAVALEGVELEAGIGRYDINRCMVDAVTGLELNASANGVYRYGGQLPPADASLKLTDGRFIYALLSAPLALDLAAEARSDRNGRVDAEVRTLCLRTSGLDLDADGRADDLLGADPRFRVDAGARACLDSLLRLLPSDFGILADGNVDISIDADARMSEINTCKFDRAKVSGRILGDRVRVRMPADTMAFDTWRPDIRLNSDPDGILVNVDLDSAYVNIADDLRAKVRGMSNTGHLTKVESNGRLTPRLEFESDNGTIFFKSGDTRAMVRSARVAAAVEKRVFDATRAPRGPRPSRSNAPAEDRLSGGDIRVAVDSTVMSYLRKWKPSGEVALGKGFVATPSLPLRTRLGEVSARFDERQLLLDTLAVKCGTSDLSAHGEVTNFFALMSSRRSRRVTSMKLNLDSRRINVNELIAAFQMGGDAAPADTSLDYDETFVVDSIAGAAPDTAAMGLIIVPGNIDAELNVKADNVRYTDIDIAPLKASVHVKDRTLQILNTSAETNLGGVNLDAYYSTKTRDDLTAGVDLKLRDISAEGIIHMLPSVDEMMPALKSFKGKMGCTISATTQIDTNMNVIIPSVDGVITITGRDLEVEDAGDLRKITRLLLFKNKNIGHINDLNVNAVVHDAKVEVFPFELGVDRYKLALRGMQGLDNTMNYHVSILKSPFLIPFGINLYGTLDNWRFFLGFPKYKEGKVPGFSKEIESVQVNIAQSIRDIFSKGVNNVKEYNRQNIKSLNASEQSTAGADMDLTREQFNEVEAFAFELDAMEWESNLAAEVDAVLEESFMDTEKLLKTYQEQVYDKRTMKRMEQLKAQSEKKKKK